MNKKSYDNTYDHYDRMLDSHKMTGRLFSFIPFYFNVDKYVMMIYMAIALFLIPLIFSFPLVITGAIFILFILFNTEYNRVYNLREKVMLDCIWTQLDFEEENKRKVTYLPEVPVHIEYTDINNIFDNAIYNYKKTSYDIFYIMFSKVKNIFR